MKGAEDLDLEDGSGVGEAWRIKGRASKGYWLISGVGGPGSSPVMGLDLRSDIQVESTGVGGATEHAMVRARE